MRVYPLKRRNLSQESSTVLLAEERELYPVDVRPGAGKEALSYLRFALRKLSYRYAKLAEFHAGVMVGLDDLH